MRTLPPVVNVHKFGGAALADAASMSRVASILGSDSAPSKVVVASAMLGVTDNLLDIAHRAAAGEKEVAAIDVLRQRHLATAKSLGVVGPPDARLQAEIDESFEELQRLFVEIAERGELTPAMTDVFLSHGDRIAARILAAAITVGGVSGEFVDATDVVRADGPHGNASPDIEETAREAERVLRPIIDRGVVPVMPGFVGRSPRGDLVTLGRGGSDLTATLLGRV